MNEWCIGADGYVPLKVGSASKYAEGWNWGAFFAPGFWTFAHRAYVWGLIYWILFCFVMPASWAVAIYLGVKGNEIALNNRSYADELDFEATESAWRYWGIGLFVVFALVQTALFLSMVAYRWILLHYGVFNRQV